MIKLLPILLLAGAVFAGEAVRKPGNVAKKTAAKTSVVKKPVAKVAVDTLPPAPPSKGYGGDAMQYSEAADRFREISIRPFDDGIYTVCYEVFLAVGNVKDAFKVAQAAVRQRPSWFGWRKRLAQTAQWLGKPEIALEQWQYMNSHQPSVSGYRQTLQLAKLLDNHAVAMGAWEGLSKLGNLKDFEWASLYREYEQVGQPERWIELLRVRAQKSQSKSDLDSLAKILLRVGDDDEALVTLETMAKLFGDSPALAMSRAQILCRHGRIAEAAAALKSVSTWTGSGHPEFLRMLGLLSAWMQRYGDALQAYRQIYLRGNYGLEDIRTLVELASDRDSTMAMEAASVGWMKYRQPEFFVFRLEKLVNGNLWDKASASLQALTPEDWNLFARIPYFWDLVGRVHQHDGWKELARQDFQHALALDSESQTLQADFLWLLMEQGRLQDLDVYVRRWEAGAESPPLLSALAAAYELLHREYEALALYQRMDEGENRDDFPFLFSYGMLLEQLGDGEGARVLFLRAKEALANPSSRQARNSRDWKDARARWAWKFGSGDEARRRMRELLKATAGTQGANELVFSWLLETGESPEDAMELLKSDPNASRIFPAWAELAVAIRQKDDAKVSALLKSGADSLTYIDKANAYAYLGDWQNARLYARKSLKAGQSVEAAEGLLWDAGDVEGRVMFISRRQYLEQRALLGGAVAVGPVDLSVSAETRYRPRIAADVEALVPVREDAGQIGLKRKWRMGTTEATVGARSANDGNGPGAEPALLWTGGLRQDWRPLRHASLSIEFDINSRADEHPVLELAGVKDLARLGMSLALPNRAELALQTEGAFYYDRDANRLGSKLEVKGDVSQRLTGSLSWGLDAGYGGFNSARTTSAANGDLLLAGWYPRVDFPQSYWRAGARMELGQEAPEPVRLGLFPFAAGDVGIAHYFAEGGQTGLWEPGFGLRGGVAVIPTHSQRLSFATAYSRGIRNRSESELLMEVRYIYFLK